MILISIILTYEQQEAFNKINQLIDNPLRRTLIFFYGMKGVGKTILAKKFMEVYKEKLRLLSINEIILKNYSEELHADLLKSFHFNHSPEEFINNLITQNYDREIIIFDNIDYIVSDEEQFKLRLAYDYDFGKYLDFNYKGKLLWSFPIDYLKDYKEYWEVHNSELKNSKFIKISPPSKKSLRDFFNLYRSSENDELSEQDINKCLDSEYFTTLINLFSRRMMI